MLILMDSFLHFVNRTFFGVISGIVDFLSVQLANLRKWSFLIE